MKRRAASGGHRGLGQAVTGCGDTIDYLVEVVFSYRTLTESHKVAALDATSKIRQVERFAR